jgi:hypothetical protein
MQNTSIYTAIRNRDVRIFAFITVIGITAIIAFFVIAFQDKHAMRDYFGIMMLTLFGGIAIGALGVWYYFKKRFNIEVSSQNKKLSLQVLDPNLAAPFVVNYPFTIKKQWCDVIMPKGPNMKRIHLTLFDFVNNPIITFHCDMGKLQKVPGDFEYVNIMNSAENGKLIKAGVNYGVNKLVNMSDEITYVIQKMESNR